MKLAQNVGGNSCEPIQNVGGGGGNSGEACSERGGGW